MNIARLCSGPIHQALVLKKFDDKYSIFRMLLHHLDLTKISVAELFEPIKEGNYWHYVDCEPVVW